MGIRSGLFLLLAAPLAAGETVIHVTKAACACHADPAAHGAMDWKLVAATLLLLAVFGAFGGLLAALSQNSPFVDLDRYEFDKKPTALTRFWFHCTVGALLGSGGALAFGFILALDDKFRDLGNLGGEHYIFIACVSVAAGFSGIRLLRLISRKLEAQVEQAEKEAREAKQAAEQAATLATAVSFASHVLNALDPLGGERVLPTLRDSQDPKPRDNPKYLALLPSLTRAIEMMEEARETHPTFRLVGIYLGRLHKARGDFAKAVAALTAVYDARGTTRDRDDAALLYNRACYRNQLALAASDQVAATKLLSEAQADLDQAVKLDPDNAAQAKDDDELQGLKGGPDKKKTPPAGGASAG